METLKIKLAGTEYEIKELTLGQLEEIQDTLVKADPKDRSRKILAVALSDGYPDITSEMIGKMRLGSVHKVARVVDEVLKFAGYELKDAKPGEAQAGAQP